MIGERQQVFNGSGENASNAALFCAFRDKRGPGQHHATGDGDGPPHIFKRSHGLDKPCGQINILVGTPVDVASCKVPEGPLPTHEQLAPDPFNRSHAGAVRQGVDTPTAAVVEEQSGGIRNGDFSVLSDGHVRMLQASSGRRRREVDEYRHACGSLHTIPHERTAQAADERENPHSEQEYGILKWLVSRR